MHSAATDSAAITRRQLLFATSVACAGSSAVAQSVAGEAGQGLGTMAGRSGRLFGFAINPDVTQKDPVRELVRRHASIITAENAMKWRSIENAAGISSYTQADRVVAIADELQAPLRGHTLAWHQSTPAYLATASSAEFVKAQTVHIQAMTQRYKGRIHTWDVLNEVIDVGSAPGGTGLRDSVLSKLWGASRYPELFELARTSDPLAKLAYNDYGMEQDSAWCERRRTAVLRMLEGWAHSGTPVDVIGLQAHLDTSRLFSGAVLLRFFNELRALGLRIQITELDVRDSTTAGDVAARDAAVARLYQEFTEACFSHPAVEMMVMWNVTDGDSWINRWSQGQRRNDGLPMRPLLFDAQGQFKPAYSAVANAMRSASSQFEGYGQTTQR